MNVIQEITAYLSVLTGVSIIFINITKVVIEWLNQRHLIKLKRQEQNNTIIMQYLNKALDPTMPLAIRQQLLRFLATPQTEEKKLEAWAKSELDRIGNVIDEINKAVKNAEQELQSAKTQEQLANAEEKLASAIKNQLSIYKPAVKPEINEFSLRAGIIEDKNLEGLDIQGKNLEKMDLVYRNLKGANFKKCRLIDASLQGCDLRVTDFTESLCTDTTFYLADLRGAVMKNIQFRNCRFQGAKLEGTDFSESTFENCDMRATYDEHTIWPLGFSPEENGCVYVKSET